MKKFLNIFKYITLIGLFALPCRGAMAQFVQTDTIENPTVLYSAPKKYEIAGITVSGIDNYEDYVLIGISGLSVGQIVSIPGEEITAAVKRYWKHGLFSNVNISVEKVVGNQAYLNIALTQRPRLSKINYYGVKKSEQEDLEAKLSFREGNQITPNMIDRAKIVIRRYFDEKGFKNADINIMQRDDIAEENHLILDITIDKKEKVKVNRIYITGNSALNEKQLKWAMKKTNEKGNWRHFFRPKKFIDNLYDEDKQLLIDKYNEYGYRDAHIVVDSVVPFDDKTVDVYIQVEEGNQYHIRNINWVGNTVYESQGLSEVLRMKPGDVYNQKMLDERINVDDDAISNLYYNNGYVFSRIMPVEVNVTEDSIDLEMRVLEGPQATINRVRIAGNDRLYENVVRRELMTKPGDLFSKDALMRSARELQQMGHFNPEAIAPDVKPDYANGTVDVNWMLESKNNDQVEFSLGYGQTGVIGKIALKFTNFSMYNLFHKSDNYRAFIPQGDGQTFTISGQTNGSYYQSYNVSFLDPWFGGKRPNSFSVNAFYALSTGVNSNYYRYMNQAYYNNYYNYYNGYGDYNNYYNNYESYYDPDKFLRMYGLSIGWGKRLHWPDDYFTLYGELAYTRYDLNNWEYFIISNGSSNNINLSINLGRSSIDNPIFPRQGSEVSFNVAVTPPYSLFDNVDYKALSEVNKTDAGYDASLRQRYKWIEYHKWKFKSKFYTALTNGQKCLVLMARADFGLLGHYNKYKKSPFETFYVGGDGMSGYSYNYYTDMVALRGYENGSLTPYDGGEGYAYSRFAMELRYPLMLENSTQIYALGFLEGGNAWTDVRKFNPFDMKRSAGVGVRIFLPMIGLMGIDWAYGFDKINGSNAPGGSQFHFILGQEF